MKKNNGFFEYVMYDLFGQMEGISSKRMFGGYGFYKDGIIFGIIAEGKLYFKAGQTNKDDFEKAGSAPFTYPMKDGSMSTISYWELPEFVMEDQQVLPEWIEKAVRESLNAKKKRR